MKNNTNRIKNFAKYVDERIPDATIDSVKEQGKTIGKDVINTGMCAVATCICATKTLEDTVELGLMITKTTTKHVAKKTNEAMEKVKNFYTNTPAMVVVR